MAKNNKISMPSGMGGLTRYFDDVGSGVTLKPGHVIILVIVVMVIVILLHLQGGAWFGI